MTNKVERKLITVAEAAKLLQKNPQNVRKNIRAGEFPGGFTVGKRCYINWLLFSQITGFTEAQIEENNDEKEY